MTGPAATAHGRERLPARIARIARMTSVRLTVLYFVLFALFSMFLVTAVSRDAARVLATQVHESIDADVAALRREYRAGGFVRLLWTLDERGRRPDAGLFYVVDPSGNPIAGNVAELPPGAFRDDGDDADPYPVDYVRFENGEENHHTALARSFDLDNGFRVLVGRDIGEREKFRAVVRRAFRNIALFTVVMGGVTWLFLSRRVLKRIDQVSSTSRRIVAGDLGGRLPVSGTGDEFDRLAVALNDMLAKIGELMKGLKEVSDNVAHDLKTPLTRLRNRVEAALAGEPSVERYREALEATIDESDTLIRTFDALLMIARIEAGSAPAEPEVVDLSAIVREVGELYEPVAEDEGARFSVSVADEIRVRGVRELLAQALVNLVDNALKYGRRDGAAPEVAITLARDGDRAVLEVRDRGPGVPEPDRIRVLERFTRLEASRNAPGSGLGLALVAAVVRRHDGRIELGDAGPGLVVRIELPPAA